jgi:3-methyladenine DNA glycosylase AlkD
VVSRDWDTAALDALDAELGARPDPQRAAQMAAYMRDQFPFLGVPAPERRAIQRHVLTALAAPTAGDVIRFAELCWERDEREFQYAAADLVRDRVTLLGPHDLPALERLVVAKSWWDTVDALAVAIGAVVRAHPGSRELMDRWLESDNLWLVRVAILHQERWGADTDVNWLFTACRRRADHPDFFVRKAIGWTLRSLAKRDPAIVRAFLDAHGGELSGVSRREAERGVARGERHRRREA